jgi:hypothetical protein
MANLLALIAYPTQRFTAQMPRIVLLQAVEKWLELGVLNGQATVVEVLRGYFRMTY